MKTLVSLLTDFGLSDPFVGEVKAAIFSICPEAEVIDITHDVERFNIRMGAFLLASATPFFPPGSVHVAVVDPGVGSERRPIAIETSRSVYVGPDNGLLVPAATREGIQHVYVLTNRSLMKDTISSTFHGRDIFAPVAAHLACGTQPKEVGEEIMNYERLSFREPKFNRQGITCEAIHIDHFGNIVTNIPQLNMEELNSIPKVVITIHSKRVRARLVKAYSDIDKKEVGLIFGSHGFLEVATREDNASRRLKTKAGDTIRLSFN
jgi:S-adenosylmethionine hydrolase